MAMMKLLELPDELLLRMLYFLDVPELLAVSRVRRDGLQTVADWQMLMDRPDLTPLADTIARSDPPQAALAVFVQPRKLSPVT